MREVECPFFLISLVPWGPMLILYRRHTKSCNHLPEPYPQNKRIFKPTNKTERAADCECPITAEGTLLIEGLITNRSTRQNDWAAAEAVVKQWEEWGQTKRPDDTEVDPDHVTIQYAVDSFLTSQGPTGRNVAAKTLNAFKVLLHQRLIPYCQSKRYRFIREFDSLDVVGEQLIRRGFSGDGALVSAVVV